jgi:UDP-2,4-diacetamido-2,4,6-trideoxy-beta-L-altropyranose hydrolase
MMKVLIRTDASTSIGSGHVMRCLTIAKAFRRKGHEIVFMMKRLPGNLIELVEKFGFQVTDEPSETDLCIIDHYGIDEKWEKAIRPFVKRIMVIDDLANRKHDCDILLDQNTVPNSETRYDSLVPANCLKLLGPKYLIMRDEFIEQRRKLRKRNSEVNRLLVFMGGVDPTRETMKVLRALSRCGHLFEHVDVVVGNGNPDKKRIQQTCENEGYSYYCQIDYLASLMASADFSIGAGGSTTWERCYLGLPSSSTMVADNQVESTETAASLGVVWNAGWHEQVTDKTYEGILLSLSKKQDELIKMSESGLDLTGDPEGPNPWIKQILKMG